MTHVENDLAFLNERPRQLKWHGGKHDEVMRNLLALVNDVMLHKWIAIDTSLGT